MRFTDAAIRDNVDIALRYVTFDLAEGNWFDAAWATARVSELGHDIAESSVEYWLRQKAEEGMYERELGEYRAC